MIRFIQKSVENRLWVFLGFSLIILAGLYSAFNLPIDAVPDITPVQVVINTKTGALDPERVEKTITKNIESEMSGLPKVKDVRSLSRFGLSQVVVVFEDDADIYRARQLVVERLQNVKESLPDGISPELGVLSTGLGEVVFFNVKAKAGSALERKDVRERLTYLRTITDYVVRPYLKSKIKNIADVDVVGGYKKQINVEVYPAKLLQYGLTFDDIVKKLETLGESFGGGYVQKDGRMIVVRTLSDSAKLDDIARIPLKLTIGGTPIALSNVASVKEGFAQRLGFATMNGEEAVIGTVFMLLSANSREVADEASASLCAIPLPDDVEIVSVYNRTFLVNKTINTVIRNLAEGAALVIMVLFLILGNIRASLIVSISIPISMLAAVIGMRFFNISANLMSLGAVDFGLLVDASVVIVENIVRRLETVKDPDSLSYRRKIGLVRESVSEVLRPVVYGLIIIMMVYVPILTLEGIEGRMFHPMAITVLMALGASMLCALILIPVLALTFLIKKQPAKEPFFFRVIHRAYKPVIVFALHNRMKVVFASVLILILSVMMYSKLGSDFLPQLDEGDFSIGLVREPGIAIDESLRQEVIAEKIAKSFPEVEHVFARTGVSEAAADPMGHYMSDMFIILKKGKSISSLSNGARKTKEDLFNAIKNSFEKSLPEMEIMASQPIQLRFNEILEGSRAEVSLRIYGPDLEKLLALQNDAKEILEKVPGTSEVELDALTAVRKGPFLNVSLDHNRLNNYGVPLKEINETLSTAMGGREVGGFYEYDWRFPVVVRLASEYRDNLSEIAKIPISLPDGGSISMSQLSRIKVDEQVNNIARNGSRRYAAVAVNLSGRDISSFVADAKKQVEMKLKLPNGYYLEWGGQFKNLERAKTRLQVIVPLTLLLIFLFILRTFGSFKQALVVYSAIPFAVTGGVFALSIRGMNLSVSAGVGFIALIGIAILNGLLLVSFINELRRGGMETGEAVVQGCYKRLRPVFMTALVASLGLLPMAVNTGLGSEVQKPLATVVIGGLITATLLTLILLPVLYILMGKTKKREG